jgi:hypothetical protein
MKKPFTLFLILNLSILQAQKKEINYVVQLAKYKIKVKKIEVAEIYSTKKKYAPSLMVTQDFTLDRLVDSVPIKYFDTLLSAELMVYKNRRKQDNIVGLGIEAYRSDGEKYEAEFNGKAITKDHKIYSFLKENPIGSYIVIKTIHLYNDEKKRLTIEDRIGWKFMK